MTVCRLAVVGRFGEISLVSVEAASHDIELLLDPEDDPPAALELRPSLYAWPAWSGDGQSLLFSTVEAPDAGAAPARVARLSLGDREIQVLYANPKRSGLVAPGLPHYLNPSPDGDHLAVLTQGQPGALSLLYVDARGRGPAQAISRGAPLFSAWSPQSDALLIHTGGELSLMELPSAPSMQLFASNHVGYRVPCWSPDGTRIAVSAQEGSRTSLLLLDRSGRTQQSLAPSWPSAALAWAPDGRTIALAQITGDSPPRQGNLQLVSTAGDGVRPGPAGAIRAFFWSPTGKRLALLVPATRPDLCSWHIVDSVGETVARSPVFRPSDEFALMTTFFDQYALSHPCWSEDGSMLLAAGKFQQNGTPLEQTGAGIFVFRPDDGSLRMVANGSFATWSPGSQGS
jgi:dipeptidyl aminopeptidase/acylaminoacyl peptidase